MSDQAHADHSRNYLKVLIALLILTVVTVLVAKYVDLGRWGNIIVGLAVAIVKASLVVLFFMHLKYEARWWAGLVIFPLVLVMIILFSNFADTGLNGAADGGDLLTPGAHRIHHVGKPGAH